ncbi:MAG: hypothetical protein Q9167_005661 [Letrouitia subvulpina]
MPGVKRASTTNISSSKAAKKPKLQSKPVYKSAERIIDSSSEDSEAPAPKQKEIVPNISQQEVASILKTKLTPVDSSVKVTRPSTDSSKKRKYISPKLSSTSSSEEDDSGDVRSSSLEEGDGSDSSRDGKVLEAQEDQSSNQKRSLRLAEGRKEQNGVEHTEDKEGNDRESASEASSDSGDKPEKRLEKPSKPLRIERPRPPYVPPPGFEPVTIDMSTSAKVADLLSPDALKGKQIWHITTPSSIPISLIEGSLQSITTEAPILSYKGAEYGVFDGLDAQPKKNEVVLLPSSENGEYRSINLAITRTLHLQQLVKLSRTHDGPVRDLSTTSSSSASYKDGPHQQPAGLRMRYRPFGDVYPSESEDGSMSEGEAKPPWFKLPPTFEASQTLKGPKPVNQANQSSPSKERFAENNSTTVNANELNHPQDLSMFSSSGRHKELSEEKARRKAERRQRKNPDLHMAESPKEKTRTHKSPKALTNGHISKPEIESVERKERRKEHKREHKESSSQRLDTFSPQEAPQVKMTGMKDPEATQRKRTEDPAVEKARRKEEHRKHKEAKLRNFGEERDAEDVSPVKESKREENFSVKTNAKDESAEEKAKRKAQRKEKKRSERAREKNMDKEQRL